MCVDKVGQARSRAAADWATVACLELRHTDAEFIRIISDQPQFAGELCRILAKDLASAIRANVVQRHKIIINLLFDDALSKLPFVRRLSFYPTF